MKSTGLPRSPSYLGISVLEDEMIPEGVVGQLGNQPMILVSISGPVGQDQCRIEIGLDRFKVVLDLGALEREIPIAKPSYIDPSVSDTLKECRRAVSGFSFASSWSH